MRRYIAVGILALVPLDGCHSMLRHRVPDGGNQSPQEACEARGGDWDSMSDIGPACL